MRADGFVPAWFEPASAERPASLDLPCYLRRIEYTGDRSPTAATLGALTAHHAAAIPFENLDPLLRLPVPLDVASLQVKLLDGRRGGYCFEHNLLFAHALTALGYEVRDLAARVLWNVPPGARPPRGHMLLLVNLGEPYVVDVGFGGLTLTGALRLVPDLEQATPHEPFRLLRAGDEFTMEARAGGWWRALYRFDLQPQLFSDYEVTSWYLSNHPQSHFIHGLMVARAAAGERHALRNTELTRHRLDGSAERRTLTTVAAMREALADVFRIALPAGPGLDRALAQIVARSAAPDSLEVRRHPAGDASPAPPPPR